MSKSRVNTLAERGRNRFLLFQVAPSPDGGAIGPEIGLYIDPAQEAHALVRAMVDQKLEELLVIHSPVADGLGFEERYLRALNTAATPHGLVVRPHDTNDVVRAEELIRRSSQQKRRLKVALLNSAEPGLRLATLAARSGFDVISLSADARIVANKIAPSDKIYTVAPWRLAAEDADADVLALLLVAGTELAVELDLRARHESEVRLPARELRSMLFTHFRSFLKSDMQRQLGTAWLTDGEPPHIRFDHLNLRPVLRKVKPR